ncbi:unnamed protein product [Ectocarpus fasciculatus]
MLVLEEKGVEGEQTGGRQAGAHQSTCRGWAKLVTSQDWFDSFVVGIILVNCVFLGLDDPTAETPPWWQQVADIVFTALFTLEMSLKLAALGLQYFMDAWNWLDAIVVAEGIFSVFFDGGPSMKSLRVLRVLRPLRTVRRMPRVQLVVTSLLRAGWTLGRIVCIFMVWLSIFAIMGVLLWSGALENRCSSSGMSSDTGGVCGVPVDHSDDISLFCSSLELLDTPYTCEEGETCEDYGSSPYSGMVNFDNLLWSLLTLFTVTTLEGWHEVMMFTQRVMSEYTIWFFVFLIVTATWAVMSLMIAAMLARFKAVSLAEGLRLMQERAEARAARQVEASVRGKKAKGMLGTAAQGVKGVMTKGGAEVGGAIAKGGGVIARGGADILAAGPTLAAGLITSHAESKPEGKTAKLVRQLMGLWESIVWYARHPLVEDQVLSEDSLFSQAIHWAIMLNVVVIGMGGHNIGDTKAAVLHDMEVGLTIIFTVEVVLKNVVLGARRYFKSRRVEKKPHWWNRFDFFVSMSSLLHLIVTTLVDDLAVTASLRLLNVLRVFRILRMRRLKRTVVTVVGVVIKSARDLWPVVALMLLMCFVFTVLGMQLFGATLDPGLEEFAAHPYAHKTRFDTFFWSFVQVFTVIAGDSWNTIMYRTMENTTAVSSLFFVALIVLGESVLLNLVLAVVLEGASDQMKEKHAAQQFRDNTLRLFHNQYKRLAMRRWSTKLRAEVMLERGQVLVLPGNTAEKLGLEDFPKPTPYRPGRRSSSSSSSSSASIFDVAAFPASDTSASPRNGGLVLPRRASHALRTPRPPGVRSSLLPLRQPLPPTPSPCFPPSPQSHRQTDVGASTQAPLQEADTAARSTAAQEGAADITDGTRRNGSDGDGDADSRLLRSGTSSPKAEDDRQVTSPDEFDRVWDTGWQRERRKKSPRGRIGYEPRIQGKSVGAGQEKGISAEGEDSAAHSAASADEGGAPSARSEAMEDERRFEPTAADGLMTPPEEFDRVWGKSWERQYKGKKSTGRRPSAPVPSSGAEDNDHGAQSIGGNTTTAGGKIVGSPVGDEGSQLLVAGEALEHDERPERRNAETLMTPQDEFDRVWGRSWERQSKGTKSPRRRLSVPSSGAEDNDHGAQNVGRNTTTAGVKIVGSPVGEEGSRLLVAGEALEHDGRPEGRSAETLMTPQDEFDRVWGKSWERQSKGMRSPRRRPSVPSSGAEDNGHGAQNIGRKVSTAGGGVVRPPVGEEGSRLMVADEALEHDERPERRGAEKMMTPPGGFDSSWQKDWIRQTARRGSRDRLRASSSSQGKRVLEDREMERQGRAEHFIRSPGNENGEHVREAPRDGLEEEGATRCEHNARDEAIEKLPKALYGMFSEMMIKKETPKWWNVFDRILGARVDRATWIRWHVRKSPARQWCGEIVAARHFETVMLGFVLGSIVLSLHETEDLSSVAGVLDTVCLAAFCVELCLRAGVYSWWAGPDAVLRNPWVLFDVYLVVSHGVCTFATVLGIEGTNRAQKVLKSARPLRIIHRVKSLQEMSEALVHSLRSCGTLLVLIATLLLGYSMIGVEVFGGLFYSCSDPEFPPKMSRYGDYDADNDVWVSAPCSGVWVNPATGLPETRDFEWNNYVYHFDSIGPAVLSAMIVTTLDGWVEIYHHATDAYIVDHQPSENYNLQAFWYFFGGILVFGFYITNLFVGVMFEAFLSFKNMDSMGNLISQAERRWRDYEKRLSQVVPTVAPCSCVGHPWRARIQRLVLADNFSNFIVTVLVVNTVVLALDHADAPDWQLTAQDIFNHTFASIFVVETCLMLYGLGFRCYFSTGRQIFEFVVTVASLIDLVMDLSGACSGHDIVILTLVRSLRVVRVIRLATHIPGFDQILAACTYPARVLLNVFVLLGIGVYVFANIGVALFSDVEIEKTTMNLYQDFSSVSHAMQLLFIVATGEAWAEYASKVAEKADQPEAVVFGFFVTFVVIMQFILTNLFIMVIVETFETLNAMERKDLEDAIPCFQETWTTFDPKGSGKLPPKHLFTFLLELKKPLGAAGNHALAGRYATMLKSAPEFDYSFAKASASLILAGLGAALLSDENHAHAKTGGYRPVNLKKIMATLVVQRALKRNMMQKRGKFNLADIVLAAEDQAGTRRASRITQQLPDSDGLHNYLGDARRFSSTAQLSTTGQGGLEGYQKQGALARGRAGSIVLPPDADESKWLMKRFLTDLQRNNDRNGQEVFTSRNRRGSLPVTGAVQDDSSGEARSTVARGMALHLLGSRRGSGSSEAKTEIGSPAARDPHTKPGGFDGVGHCLEDGTRFVGRGTGGLEEEEKLENLDGVPETSLASWLRDRRSVDL